MNADRLLRVADLLEHVDPARFDLGYWATPECGTTCCAVGFAALDPRFQEEGLRLHNRVKRLFRPGLPQWVNSIDDLTDRRLHRVTQAGITYRGFRNWMAVERFFDLSERDCRHLFSPRAYHAEEQRAPDAVAERIRAFVAKRTVVPALEPEVERVLADHAG